MDQIHVQKKEPQLKYLSSAGRTAPAPVPLSLTPLDTACGM
jgi:hypothetical protein